MGYIKTAPVNVILIETCKLPFLLQDEIATANFLSKQLYYNNTLAALLHKNQTIPKFEDIIRSYDLLNKIPKKRTFSQHHKT